MELNRRQTHRAAIHRMNVFAAGEDINTVTLIELNERLTALQISYEHFVEEHQNVVANVVGDMTEQERLFDDVSEERMATAVRFRTRIAEITEQVRQNEEQERLERERNVQEQERILQEEARIQEQQRIQDLERIERERERLREQAEIDQNQQNQQVQQNVQPQQNQIQDIAANNEVQPMQ